MNINNLFEKSVSSTWLADVANNRRLKVVTMALSDGKVYAIHGMTRHQFDNWHKSASKGEYFHKRVKDKYVITRLK